MEAECVDSPKPREQARCQIPSRMSCLTRRSTSLPSSMAYVSVRLTSNLTAMVVYDDTTQRCAGIGTDAIGADANMAASYMSLSVKVHVVSTLRAFVL